MTFGSDTFKFVWASKMGTNNNNNDTWFTGWFDNFIIKYMWKFLDLGGYQKKKKNRIKFFTVIEIFKNLQRQEQFVFN